MDVSRLFRRTREILRDEGPAALERRARRRLWGDQAQVFADYADWRRAAPAGPRATAPPKGTPISVVVPVHDPPPRALFEFVRSLREQHYRTWDAVLVDDGCRDAEVVRLLAEAERDPRIAVVRHTSAQGIGAATAAGVRRAGQDLVAFVDHDDVLDPEALSLVAEACAADPTIDLLYTDEDKLDDHGDHLAPWLKPGWDPLLLYSWNYVGHLAVVRRRALEAAGGFAPEVDGAQDFDLMLRVAERARRVAHLPQVLYHWRAIPGSAADSPAAKPDAHRAARVALERALARRGLAGRIEPAEQLGRFRLVPEPRYAPGEVSALVVDDRPPAWLTEAGVEHVLTLGPDATPALVDAVAARAPGRARLLVGAGVTPRGEPRRALESLLGWLQLAGLVTGQLVHADRVVEQGLVLGRLSGERAGPFEAVTPGDPGYFGLCQAPRSAAAASARLLLVDAEVWRDAGGLTGPGRRSGPGGRGSRPGGRTDPGEGVETLDRAAAGLCARARAQGARLAALPLPFDVPTSPSPLALPGGDPWHHPQFRPDARLRLAPQGRPRARVREARSGRPG